MWQFSATFDRISQISLFSIWASLTFMMPRPSRGAARFSLAPLSNAIPLWNGPRDLDLFCEMPVETGSDALITAVRLTALEDLGDYDIRQ